MPITRTMIFLAFLSNSVSAISAIIDDDINLVCGPYLFSITTTIADKVNNKFDKRNYETADMHYDFVVLQKNELAKELNLERSGTISYTEIFMSGRYDYTVNRQTGILEVVKMEYDSSWGMYIKPKPITKYSCKSASRKRLDNLIKNHNKPINDSYNDRKF